jgi:protein-tyrosine phosphatase
MADPQDAGAGDRDGREADAPGVRDGRARERTERGTGEADVPGARDGGAPERTERATRLLFVCLGNICRSPTAEGVMRALVEQAGLQDRVEVDSAGTGAWHVGNPPDARAVAAARARGIGLDGRARQIRREDFDDFDLMLAMDSENMRELRRLAPGRREREKVRLLREFDPAGGAGEREQPSRPLARRVAGDLDVPDPYYGAAGGFEEVLELVHAACVGLLAQIQSGRLP